ncbi:MAG: HPr family phosphocarrier protein [Planctomycetia bacterium]|nr:HPr family phosphocarrier protein [Planctomycetia bacterium]
MSGSPVVSRSFTVKLVNGLHLRPWMGFVKLCQRYQAKIEVVKESARCDGRSMLSLLSLSAKCGDVVVIEASGEDAEQALTALIEFLDGYVDAEEME